MNRFLLIPLSPGYLIKSLKNHFSCNFSLHTRANVLCATFYVLYIQFTPFHFRRIVKHIFENLSLNLGPHLNHKFQPINYTKNLSCKLWLGKATMKLFADKFSPLVMVCLRMFSSCLILEKCAKIYRIG